MRILGFIDPRHILGFLDPRTISIAPELSLRKVHPRNSEQRPWPFYFDYVSRRSLARLRVTERNRNGETRIRCTCAGVQQGDRTASLPGFAGREVSRPPWDPEAPEKLLFPFFFRCNLLLQRFLNYALLLFTSITIRELCIRWR